MCDAVASGMEHWDKFLQTLTSSCVLVPLLVNLYCHNNHSTGTSKV